MENSVSIYNSTFYRQSRPVMTLRWNWPACRYIGVPLSEPASGWWRRGGWWCPGEGRESEWTGQLYESEEKRFVEETK